MEEISITCEEAKEVEIGFEGKEPVKPLPVIHVRAGGECFRRGHLAQTVPVLGVAARSFLFTRNKASLRINHVFCLWDNVLKGRFQALPCMLPSQENKKRKL